MTNIFPIAFYSQGIVLIQEWWGMNKAICRTADTFAQKGYAVICPDM